MPDRILAPNLARLYQSAARKYGALPAFATRVPGGGFQPVSFEGLYERGLELATGLIGAGLEAREHVGLIADNRFEWILCDCGILLAGAADVPRGTDSTEAEIAYILDHCDARFVFVENDAVLARVLRLRPHLPRLQTVVVMAPKNEIPPGVLTLDGIRQSGRALRAGGDRRAEERIAAVRPEDLFTIIYTSGTTGTPKGVQLTHANMASQIKNLPISLYPGERALSILPIWHSYERVFEMVAISMGVCTHYTSIRSVAEDLKTVRPHVMASAPRLWESLYQKLLARVKASSPLKRSLFAAACASSRAVQRSRSFFKGQELDTVGRGPAEKVRLSIRRAGALAINLVPSRVLDRLVLSKLREAVGFQDFRGTISGGGALQPHVDEFFNAIGIPVLEGYGLTETSPVLAVRTWDNLVIGTVGPLYPETEVRIVDLNSGAILYPSGKRGRGRGLRGEIHVRGPQVMRGYYKDPARTAGVLRDGWFNTGDIGMVTFNDCLKILGRSKETIVLLNGENVEPVPIESRLTASPLIEACMVTGQDQKALGALIVPSLDGLRHAGVHATDLPSLAADLRASELIEAEIRRLVGAHTGFKSFERISGFRLLPKGFEPGVELTHTHKIRRHVVTETYEDLVAQIHAG